MVMVQTRERLSSPTMVSFNIFPVGVSHKLVSDSSTHGLIVLNSMVDKTIPHRTVIMVKASNCVV